MKKGSLLAIVLLSGALAGCVTTGHKMNVSSVEKIREGETTKEEVFRLLGPPEQTARLSNGDSIFTYLYTFASAKPATFIPFFGIFFAGANVENQFVNITFGPDNIIKSYSTTYGQQESRMGSGDNTDMEEYKKRTAESEFYQPGFK